MTAPQAPSAPRTNWLRRNLIALIVLVLAIPGLVVVVYVLPALDNQGREQVTTIAQGKSITVSGYSFTLTRSQEFVGTGDGPGGNHIPVGSSLIGTIVEVKPLENPKKDGSCDIELTERTGASELTWRKVSNVSDFDYAIRDDSEGSCTLSGEPLNVETVFLTPTGTYKHATVDVSGITGALSPEIYRFSLVH